jgi:ribosomal protein L13E
MEGQMGIALQKRKRNRSGSAVSNNKKIKKSLAQSIFLRKLRPETV